MLAELCSDIGRFHLNPAGTELDAALLANRFLDESIDTAAVRERLDQLVGLHDGQPWEALASLGFSGDPAYDLEQGSRLDQVLERRKGLPITLGVVLLHVSRLQGLTAVGINFPGHFLVRVDEQLIDPFVLHPTSEAHCLAQLDGRGPRDPFVVAQPGAILLRMFNNLKGAFAAAGAFHRCLDALECQLALLPDDPMLRFEQGEFWLRIGSVGGARAAFEAVLEAEAVLVEGSDSMSGAVRGNAAGNIAKMARQRLVDLTGQDDVRH